MRDEQELIEQMHRLAGRVRGTYLGNHLLEELGDTAAVEISDACYELAHRFVEKDMTNSIEKGMPREYGALDECAVEEAAQIATEQVLDFDITSITGGS